MVEKGIDDSSFLQFLSEQVEDDRKSVASWGTGETTYTEIVTTQETSNTTTRRSITSGGTAFLSTEEQEKRKGIVQVRLLMRGVTDKEVDDILQNKDPYQLAFSGIHLSSWGADKEVFLIMAKGINSKKHNRIKMNHDKGENKQPCKANVTRDRSTWNLMVGNITSFPNEFDGQNKYKLDKLKELVMRGQTDILLMSEHNRNIQIMQKKSQPLEILRK